MKRAISVTLSLLLMLACLTGLSLSTSAAWNGSYSPDFAGGTGTEADPYLIASEQDLALLAKKSNEENVDLTGVYFKLTVDLDLGGTAWTPIGQNIGSALAFRGVFDGDGHTVAGLNCQSENNFGGLFGKVEGGTIKNLTVTGTLVSSAKYAGGIAGLMHKGGTIYNCHASIQSIKGTTAGGIVGRTQDTGEGGAFNTVKGCTSDSTIDLISGKDCYGGGIVGAAGAVEVVWCINRGDINGAEGSTKSMMLGGIIGIQGASSVTGHLRNCYNTGNLKGLALVDATYAGGLVGRAAHVNDSEIENSFSVGSVSVVNESNAPMDGNYGSLFGHIRNVAWVKNCYTSIAFTEMPEVGNDAYMSVEAGNVTVLTVDKMQGTDAVTNMKLGAGWVADPTGYPTIDLAAISDAPVTPDTDAPTPDTTPSGADTTSAPTPDTTPAVVDTTPSTAPTPDTTPSGGDTTPAPTEPGDEPGGVNVFVILIIAVVVVAAGAIVLVVVSEKKKAK